MGNTIYKLDTVIVYSALGLHRLYRFVSMRIDALMQEPAKCENLYQSHRVP
jgi:hypothetical protein